MQNDLKPTQMPAPIPPFVVDQLTRPPICQPPPPNCQPHRVKFANEVISGIIKYCWLIRCLFSCAKCCGQTNEKGMQCHHSFFGDYVCLYVAWGILCVWNLFFGQFFVASRYQICSAVEKEIVFAKQNLLSIIFFFCQVWSWRPAVCSRWHGCYSQVFCLQAFLVCKQQATIVFEFPICVTHFFGFNT